MTNEVTFLGLALACFCASAAAWRLDRITAALSFAAAVCFVVAAL